MERQIVRRHESQLDALDDQSLFRRSWHPPKAEQVLLLVHGFAEHSGRYDPLGEWFASRGFAVEAYDHRGHGRSEGRRCHVDSFRDLLEDLSLVFETVRREHPGLPITLIGHSMGGLVVTRFLLEHPAGVTAAVTSGAALRPAEGMSRSRITAARWLRRLSPHTTLDARLDPEWLSRDPRVVRRYIEDPLVERRLTLAFAAELMGAMRGLESRAHEVRIPMLLLHGEDDQLCPPAGSVDFHKGLEAKGSELRLYPGLRHEIFNEPEFEDVFQDVFDWLRRSEAKDGGQ